MEEPPEIGEEMRKRVEGLGFRRRRNAAEETGGGRVV